MGLREARAALRRAQSQLERVQVAWLNPPEKARLAGRLFSDGILSTDVEDRLIALNTLRKDVAYGEPGPELQEMDLEELAVELEQFLEEVEEIVGGATKKK